MTKIKRYWRLLFTLFSLVVVVTSWIKTALPFTTRHLVDTTIRRRYLSKIIKSSYLLKSGLDAHKIIHAIPPVTSKECNFTLCKNIQKYRLFSRSPNTIILEFNYRYNELDISGNNSSAPIGIILIHPIGVGIGKWFYERLLSALWNNPNQNQMDLKVIVPDLLGSGTASNPTVKQGAIRHLPMLNISDWSDQILDVMLKTQQTTSNISSWCIVANGGCSPIALQVAQKSAHHSANITISNIILSSVPRLPFFLQSSDPKKVAKSYKRLCGILGNVFWWYALKNEGAFLQKFSEKNLVADPQNLGSNWRRNCYNTAIMNEGKSKYSTFCFLAGVLQDGCVQSLEWLNSSSIKLHLIKGIDSRRNRAKSWFWQKKKIKSEELNNTLSDYLKSNGIEGNEATVNGRVSLAHEDAVGYCYALLSFLES